MVTWLHFWHIYTDAMDSAVTEVVTIGYIGYNLKMTYNKKAKQGRDPQPAILSFVYLWHLHLI